MKNRKLNLDRPPVDSREIQAGMNFGKLMVSYQAMSKPFYKSPWFFGTTGLASIGLIVGGAFAFQSPDQAEAQVINQMITDVPPPETQLRIVDHKETGLALNPPLAEEPEKEIKTVLIDQNKTNDKNLDPLIEEKEELKEELNDNAVSAPPITDESVKTGVGSTDITPRINGKVNGSISREDLLDNKGITTGSDVSIIHFELHLIDGLGGKVFEEESNQLNEEMKNALQNVSKGEMIYFENIRGKTTDGHVVRLNPLRYVLMN